MKAAVIGDSARGHYGHSMESVFNDRPGISIVAVADPVEGGRKKMQKVMGAARDYADFREMLAKERPDLVMVAPRWTEDRHAMISAALEVGAHVLCEKPFVHSMEEADDLLARAARARRVLAVALPQRFSPAILYLKQRIDQGMIGELRAIRANGKQDKRAGGEDMIVHGAHIFDHVRHFAGEATEVRARILHQGREITKADVRQGTYDRIGPVAGDDVEAWIKVARGIEVHYTTRQRPSAPAGAFSLELTGAKGAVRIDLNFDPIITVQAGKEWRPLEGNPAERLSKEERERKGANRRIVDAWLAAIAENREPAHSGAGSLKVVEIICGIYASALSGKPVALPPKDRRHPLLT